MGKIESAGTYRGVVKESGVTTTKKGFPQWVARLLATEKYVTTTEELKHFQLTEPQWVPWEYDEELVAFLVLFNNAEEFNKQTAMLNYEQLQKATGWKGDEFDSLADGTLINKPVLFRVEYNSYTNPDTGKTTAGMQINWIDAADASPERQLKSLAGDDIKALSKKLKISAPAKPATAPKPVAAKPNPTPVAAPTAAAATAPATTPAATPVAPKAPPAPKKKATTPPPATAPAGVIGLPKETDQMGAWEYLQGIKGATEDNDVSEAWIAACTEVGENREEKDFLPADWAKVRDIVIKDLDLTVMPKQAA